FVIAAPKVFLQFALGQRNAGGQKFLDFAETNLIAHELFYVLFSQTEGRQPVLHNFIELVNVKARIAMKSRQLTHGIGNRRRAGAYSQPFRFMPQDQQVSDEVDPALSLVPPGPSRSCSPKIHHYE